MRLPDELQSCYEQGQTARACGLSIDDCPKYRNPGKAAAWRRGWHWQDNAMRQPEVRHSAEEVAVAVAALAEIRARNKLAPLPSGWVQEGWIWHYFSPKRGGRTACGRWWYIATAHGIRTAPLGVECPDCRFWLDWRAQQRTQAQAPQAEEPHGFDHRQPAR